MHTMNTTPSSQIPSATSLSQQGLYCNLHIKQLRVLNGMLHPLWHLGWEAGGRSYALIRGTGCWGHRAISCSLGGVLRPALQPVGQPSVHTGGAVPRLPPRQAAVKAAWQSTWRHCTLLYSPVGSGAGGLLGWRLYSHLSLIAADGLVF